MVSVVIVTYNRKDDLRKALRSVESQEGVSTEVIVVDNASADGTLAMLHEEFPRVSVIALEDNRGMDGYSEGFRRARGEFIFQMDNDSLMPDATVLSETARRMSMGPEELAVIATRVEEYSPSRDEIERLRSKDTRRGAQSDLGFHSGGVLFRKSALDRVGHYSREIFLYGSELFLQVKFLAAGYRIEYHPDILMLHTSSSGARNRGRGIYYEVRNRLWFIRAWGGLGQRVRHLPRIVLHDLIYGTGKGALVPVFKAMKHGFGAIPADLHPRDHGRTESVLRLVEEVGCHFTFGMTMKRIMGRLR